MEKGFRTPTLNFLCISCSLTNSNAEKSAWPEWRTNKNNDKKNSLHLFPWFQSIPPHLTNSKIIHIQNKRVIANEVNGLQSSSSAIINEEDIGKHLYSNISHKHELSIYLIPKPSPIPFDFRYLLQTNNDAQNRCGSNRQGTKSVSIQYGKRMRMSSRYEENGARYTTEWGDKRLKVSSFDFLFLQCFFLLFDVCCVKLYVLLPFVMLLLFGCV